MNNIVEYTFKADMAEASTPRPVSLPKGCEIHTPSYATLYATGTNFMRLHQQRLERNKYAPWGRQAY